MYLAVGVVVAVVEEVQLEVGVVGVVLVVVVLIVVVPPSSTMLVVTC